MPGMHGHEVALLLEPTRPEMKVLYVSGYPDASIVHQGLLKPGLAFLQKPFGPDAWLGRCARSWTLETMIARP